MPASPPNPAPVISVINLKGGVGKTHTTWLLASVCAETQKRALLLDTDAQGNLTSSFFPSGDAGQGMEALFHPGADADMGPIIRTTDFSQIDLVPGSPALARFDLSDQRQWEKADLQFSLVDPINQQRSRYDLVVFDCPPRLSLVSFAALCASDFVIIPMEAADWGAQGIMQVTAAIEYVQSHYNPRLKLLGYLVSRFKRARTYQQTYLKQLRAHFGPLAFDTVIPDLAQFERSVTDRIPITLYAKRSEEASIARNLFSEVERRIQGHARGRRVRGGTNLQQAASVGA